MDIILEPITDPKTFMKRALKTCENAKEFLPRLSIGWQILQAAIYQIQQALDLMDEQQAVK